MDSVNTNVNDERPIHILVLQSIYGQNESLDHAFCVTSLWVALNNLDKKTYLFQQATATRNTEASWQF